MKCHKMNNCEQNVRLHCQKNDIQDLAEESIEELKEAKEVYKGSRLMINELVEAVDRKSHDGHTISNLGIEHEM